MSLPYTAVRYAEHLLRGRSSLTPAALQDLRNFVFLQFDTPLGSVVHATPLFEALRRAVPNAHISVLASGMAYSVLQHNPHLSACLRIPSPIDSFGASLRATQAHLRAIPPGPRALLTTIGNQRTRVALLALAGGKSLRAGYTLAPELYDIALPFHPERGQIEGNLDILRALGHVVPFTEPRVYCTDQDQHDASAFFNGFDPALPRIACVTQNSGGQHNQWSVDRFRETITALTQRFHGVHVFLGTATDAPAIEGLRTLLEQPGISLAGRTTIPQLAAVLAQCDLALSLDTGTFHVARAVGLPGVVLAPAWQSALEWLPVGHPRYHVLQGPRLSHAPPGYRLQEISVEQVLAAASDLLQQFPPSPASRRERQLASLAALRQ